jgi:hypothetical protein
MCNEFVICIGLIIEEFQCEEHQNSSQLYNHASISLYPCQHEIYPTLLSSTKKMRLLTAKPGWFPSNSSVIKADPTNSFCTSFKPD